MTEHYITEPDAADLLPDAGWIEIAPGLEISRVPLVDLETSLWARLTYAGALSVAKRLGGRLPTRGEVMAYTFLARRLGAVLKPVTLSYGPEMVGLAHAIEHDRQVKAQIEALSPEKQRGPIAGIGKHWVGGAKKGWARICGWWNGLRFIQLGVGDNHLDSHHDYATTTHVVRAAQVVA